MIKKTTPYFFLLLFLVVVKALCMTYIILHSGIGLGPDEAQYWTWSRLLDWGYYSKPPGIAWEIWLGTHFFSNTELGVRAIPLILGTLLPLLVYWIARLSPLPSQASFWAGIMMAFTPIGTLASLLAITDGGMVLFWTCAILIYQLYSNQSLHSSRSSMYFWIGLCVLAGALFKWPTYLLWPLLLIVFVIIPELRSRHIFLGMTISLLALLPVLYWNQQHGWVTFKHVGATVTGGASPDQTQPLLSLFHFLGAQLGLISPILFILLLCAFWQMYRHWSSIPLGIRFCGSLTFFSLSLGIIFSLFMKMQGNWAIFAYPTAFILLSWYVFEEGVKGTKRKTWLIVGILSSITLNTLAIATPYIQSHHLLSSFPIPYKWNLFRHNIGWDELPKVLTEAGYNPKEHFLFAHTYQTTSILSFYGPEQKRAYFLNLTQRRQNQFSFWPGMDKEQQGSSGFFVVVENIPQINDMSLVNEYLKALSPYFKEVRFQGLYPLFSAYGEITKGAFIFYCIDYNGLLPMEIELF